MPVDTRQGCIVYLNFPSTPDAFIKHVQWVAAQRLLDQYASSADIPEATAWQSQLQEHVFTNPKTLLQLLIDRHQDVRIFIPPEDLRDAACFFAIPGSVLRNIRSCVQAAKHHPLFLQHPALLHVLHLNTVFIEQYVGTIFGAATIASVEAFGHGVNLRGRFVATLRSHIFYTFRNPPELELFDVLPHIHQNTNIALLNETHTLTLSDYFEQNDQPTWLADTTLTPPRIRGINNANWLAKVPEILAYIQTLPPQNKEVPLRLFVYSYLVKRLTITDKCSIRENTQIIAAPPWSIGRTFYHEYHAGLSDYFVELDDFRHFPLVFVNDIQTDELVDKLYLHGMTRIGSRMYAGLRRTAEGYDCTLTSQYPSGICLVADHEGVYFLRANVNHRLQEVLHNRQRNLPLTKLSDTAIHQLRNHLHITLSFARRLS